MFERHKTRFFVSEHSHFSRHSQHPAVPALVVASFDAALDGVDVVVAHPLAASATAALCESRGIPWVYATLQPVFVTSSFPDLIVAGESGAYQNCASRFESCWLKHSFAGRISALNSPRVNRATYSILSNLFWLSEKPWVDPLRKRLGLRVLPHSVIHADLLSRLGVPIIMASSLLFVPGGVRPRDWPPNLIITEFLFPPASAHDEQPMDPKLTAFVSHVDPSRPLVVIGFGSLPFLGGGAALLQLAIDVADTGRLRVLLLTGWTSDHDTASGAPPPPRRTHEHVFVARAAPHDAVFRCAAAVAHHGGAGTCGACLRAGMPQVPCPLLVDQPHNDTALVASGVAPASLQLNKLTGATLGAALSAAAREPQYKHQALNAAAKVQAASEAGVKLAVHAIMSATVPADWATRGDEGTEGQGKVVWRGALRFSLVAGVRFWWSSRP